MVVQDQLKDTIRQIHQIESFPDIPVFVVTGGKDNRLMPTEAQQKRLANQKELLKLSNNSKQIVARKSGHFPQLTEPQVVIDTIKSAIETVSEN